MKKVSSSKALEKTKTDNTEKQKYNNKENKTLFLKKCKKLDSLRN